MAYAVVMAPPTSERYQNGTGMWLSRRRSDEIHCTMKRAANTNWPRKPMRTQKSQVLGSRLMAAEFIPLRSSGISGTTARNGLAQRGGSDDPSLREGSTSGL